MKQCFLTFAAIAVASTAQAGMIPLTDYGVFAGGSLNTGSNVMTTNVFQIGTNGNFHSHGGGSGAQFVHVGGNYSSGSNVDLGSNVTPADLIVTGNVNLGGGYEIYGSVHAGGTITGGSNVKVHQDLISLGSMNLGGGTTVDGMVHSGGNVAFGSNSTVSGGVFASGTVSAGGGSNIGTPQTGVAAPTPLTFTPVVMPGFSSGNAVDAGASNLNVGGGGALSLDPGSYGALTTGSNATITLSPGEYHFNSINLGGGTKFDVSAGPVTIYVAGNIVTGSNAQFIGNASQIYIEALGTSNFGGGTQVLGTLLSNNITTGSNVKATGALYALNAIDLGGGTHVNFQLASNLPSQFQIPDTTDPTGPTDLNPVPEPGSLALLGFGGLGLAGWRRRKAQREAAKA
ncbi:MAG: PEP-CTERM sorting domain-containing protein [Planctomyces sp.]|nr:PEP-CTERM sorting domain-containing protein [Planctomyces sp.]